jgi:UDP-N-acetyl-2-amino-2-deoxyglucuronate dehydrogenase
VKKVNFALVGCGRIGNRHAEHISRIGNLSAVCDTDKKKADDFSSLFKTRSYYNIEDLLSSEKEIDVVSVCTPNGFHAEHAIKSLRSGFHVLCEKPLATNVMDCGEMIKAAEKANKRLFIVKQNRFNPPVTAVREAIDKGVLGKINSIQLNCFWNRNRDYYSNSWKGTLKYDGGTLFTQFSHFIDLLYWLVGDVKDVKAFTRNYEHQGIIEFEDTGVVILEFYNGAIGTINYTVNSYEKNMEGSLTIFAENGTVKIGGQYLNTLEYAQVKDYVFQEIPEGNKPNNYGNYQGSMSNHGQVYENVVNVLTNSGSIYTNMFEGLKTVEIIERIYQAANR